MLIPIFVFNLAVDTHESNLFWSQFFKFSIMILLDDQFKFQQEIIRRKQFQKLSCNAIVQSFIEKAQMMETFQVQYCDDSKQIQLINQPIKQRVNEFLQFDFKQRIRNIIIRTKSKRTEHLIDDNKRNFQERYLQNFNDTKLIQFLKKHQQKVELDGIIDETLNVIHMNNVRKSLLQTASSYSSISVCYNQIIISKNLNRIIIVKNENQNLIITICLIFQILHYDNV
ncbi:unnamed protein product (macronuclear) [Paramecium tetraurelia]|uniref:Transmembrane protein n=1 Tax=Paramecium tetraurelia TaxID=5888 RepID=A0E9B1_PARTE|nr:uncharacterized protein GSPATT00024609001 [Paramecium tetraurelia]CAK91878.1 unnamed protein product [Paramecium tetraurelia]|eukprot:XP_001459275.1 hypothetical protein (macronuclear) [Paramecium tetraurelia strain d4-2]